MAAIATISYSQAVAQSGFESKWDNGYKVESKDGNFKMKFGGRIQYDVAAFFQDAAMEDAFGVVKDGVEFRRVRFFNSGTVYSNVKYKVQLSFEAGRLSFKDVYIELTDIPIVGNFRVGHFKEPFRLEVMTSSKYMTFMERSFHSAYAPERNTGFMLHNKMLNSRLFWQFAVLRNGNSFGDDIRARDGVNIVFRLSGVAFQNKDKKQLLHLGGAYSHRKPESEKYIIALRPESHLAPRYASTGVIDSVSKVNLFSLEAALVLNSFSFQTELVYSNVSADGVQLKFPTYYAQVSYFLTGESRVYKGGTSGFSRVSPKKNFGGGGSGAWEVALRFSNGDLTDGDRGGRLNDITIGVNWHLNPVTRVALNYINANLKDVGTTNILQTRFQVDF